MKRKFTKIGLLVGIGFIIIVITLGFISRKDEPTTTFITANPLDLSEISFISPFRSCMGHDYSGKNIDGVRETNRSMKHYIGLKNNTSGSRTQVFAPFSGKITHVELEQSIRDSQIWIQPDKADEFIFVFFHIDLVPGLAKDSQVQSGQLIGYATIKTKGDNFDIGLKKSEIFGGPNIFDSPFNYMTNEVRKEFEMKGITRQNVIISKEQRDTNPCKFVQGSDQGEQIPLQ